MRPPGERLIRVLDTAIESTTSIEGARVYVCGRYDLSVELAGPVAHLSMGVTQKGVRRLVGSEQSTDTFAAEFVASLCLERVRALEARVLDLEAQLSRR